MEDIGAVDAANLVERLGKGDCGCKYCGIPTSLPLNSLRLP